MRRAVVLREKGPGGGGWGGGYGGIVARGLHNPSVYTFILVAEWVASQEQVRPCGI